MCKPLTLSAALITLCFLLSSCTPGERGALAGAAIGAGTGALIGDSTGALIGGAIGAVAGSELSKSRAHREYGYTEHDEYYGRGPGHGHKGYQGHKGHPGNHGYKYDNRPRYGY